MFHTEIIMGALLVVFGPLHIILGSVLKWRFEIIAGAMDTMAGLYFLTMSHPTDRQLPSIGIVLICSAAVLLYIGFRKVIEKAQADFRR